MTVPHIATCPTCSTVVADSDRFCKSCGTVVSGLSAPLPIGGTAAEPDAASPEEVPLGASSSWDLVLARLRSATSGEFEIGRELGRGGMAAVFLARDLALGRRVALKVMTPGLMLGEGMVHRFRQEAITVANLSHAHIVTIHSVRQLQNLHFFVMQFVEGQSLEAVLRAHDPLPLDIVRVILRHVGSALDYAHRRGVVHRDIKPGNILLSGDGDALVTDFGIAKVAEGPRQTQAGMVVGTPTYMSPEQCFAQELDGSSDQYSLGVVAYRMLTGHVPFSGAAFEIMRGHTSTPVPPMRAVRPDIPESVEAAVRRMLAKTPGERFASLHEALGALGAHAIDENSPLRDELVRLAAVEERREQLGELLWTQSTPVSGARRLASDPVFVTTPASATPAASAPALTTPGPVPPAPMRATPLAATTPPAPVRIEPPLVPDAVHALLISTMPADVRVGDTYQMHAVPVDAAGQSLPRVVSWSAVGSAAEVTADGIVRAVAAGRAALTASCDEVYETVVLTVGPVRAAVSGGDAPLPATAGNAPVATIMSLNTATGSARTAATRDTRARAPKRSAPRASTPTGTTRPRWIYALAAAVPVLLVAFLLRQPIGDAVAALASTAITLATARPEPIDLEAPRTTETSAVSATERSSPLGDGGPALLLRFLPPPSTTLRVTETVRLQVAASNATSGRDVAQPSVRFTTSDRSVARVDSSTGEVTAVSAGRVTITADVGGDVRATLPLVVVANAASTQPTAPLSTDAATVTTTPPATTTVPTAGAEADGTRPANARYSVQLAALNTLGQAEESAQRFRARGVDVRIDGTSAPFRVRSGYFATYGQANRRLAELKQQGVEGFIAELTP